MILIGEAARVLVERLRAQIANENEREVIRTSQTRHNGEKRLRDKPRGLPPQNGSSPAKQSSHEDVS